MIREFTLPRAGKTATIEILNQTHLAQVLALQDDTRAALPEEQKLFVLPQSKDYFDRLLSRKNGFMLGVRCDGQLIAQMALMGPLTLDEAIQNGTITRNDVPFHHAEPQDLVIIAKSMSVHPSWRGNELSQHLLEAALDQPVTRAADHMFAQISVKNTHSWEVFLRQGFGIVAAALDPIDHKPRYILQRPALGFSLHPLSSVSAIDPVADFAATIRLTGVEALIGGLQDGETTSLSFRPSNDTAAAWTDERVETPLVTRKR